MYYSPQELERAKDRVKKGCASDEDKAIVADMANSGLAGANARDCSHLSKKF